MTADSSHSTQEFYNGIYFYTQAQIGIIGHRDS